MTGGRGDQIKDADTGLALRPKHGQFEAGRSTVFDDTPGPAQKRGIKRKTPETNDKYLLGDVYIWMKGGGYDSAIPIPVARNRVKDLKQLCETAQAAVGTLGFLDGMDQKDVQVLSWVRNKIGFWVQDGAVEFKAAMEQGGVDTSVLIAPVLAGDAALKHPGV